MQLKNSLKKLTIKLANTRGYELIPGWSFEKQPLVRHLKTLFERYAIDCVIDVGGNMGQYHDLLREDVGFKGWIFSFEPVDKYVQMLKAKCVGDPQWKVFDFALGSAGGTAIINVTKSPGLNSFLQPRTDAVEGYWKSDSVVSTEDVRICVLDDLFAALMSEHGCSAPYLKLDTQGFDMEVIKGASHCLGKIRALQTEASIKPLYSDMPGYRDMIDHLVHNGFELSGMFPVSQDAAMRLIEFDCVMTSSRYAKNVPGMQGD